MARIYADFLEFALWSGYTDRDETREKALECCQNALAVDPEVLILEFSQIRDNFVKISEILI